MKIIGRSKIIRPHKQVLVIGLDGATLDLIVPWAQQGKLPALGNLIANGTYGTLLSTLPPMSPPAWVSCITGVNPGKHGVFLFENLDLPTFGNTQKSLPVDSSQFAGTTLFDILSAYHLKTVTYRVPMTYPAWAINGFMVSGYPGPATIIESSAYPNRVQKRIKGYPEYPDFKKALSISFGDTLQDDRDILPLWYGIRIQRDVEAIVDLLSEEQWELFFAVFGVTDDVQHHFWQYLTHENELVGSGDATTYRDIIYQIYRKVDDAIGKINNIRNHTLRFEFLSISFWF